MYRVIRVVTNGREGRGGGETVRLGEAGGNKERSERMGRRDGR